MKNLGFNQVKIYNGGIKDWRKNGFPLESRKSLPESEVAFVNTERLFELTRLAEPVSCRDPDGRPLLTLVDFRNSNHLVSSKEPAQIKTSCPIQKLLMDDIHHQENRERIPTDHHVITITETGNRDEFAIRYLSEYGYTNINGLRFGMRGWLKNRFPVK